MKILTFPIGNDLLEVDNNMWTGVETVTFNGHIVSRAFNWFKGVHEFGIATEDGAGTDFYRVVIRMNYTGMVSVDVYRNEVCLLANSSEARAQLERGRRGISTNNQPPRHNKRPSSNRQEAERVWREEDLV